MDIDPAIAVNSQKKLDNAMMTGKARTPKSPIDVSACNAIDALERQKTLDNVRAVVTARDGKPGAAGHDVFVYDERRVQKALGSPWLPRARKQLQHLRQRDPLQPP
jgi:hypothetical protein